MPILILHEIGKHVSIRKLEWVLAGMTIHLGIHLLGSADTMVQPSFAVLQAWMSENQWGVLLVIFGSFRLLALILNGYYLGYRSGQIRWAFSACSFLIFTALAIGFDASGTASTGGVTYKWLALGELANCWQAATDIRSRSKLGYGK